MNNSIDFPIGFDKLNEFCQKNFLSIKGFIEDGLLIKFIPNKFNLEFANTFFTRIKDNKPFQEVLNQIKNILYVMDCFLVQANENVVQEESNN